MCRFAAYLGKPIQINEVISKPHDSLIKQSLKAEESEIKLNADGFGIGWYNPDVSHVPAIYRSILPAWNDINLKSFSHQLTSPCFFAHVRAGEEGSLALVNCHPFFYDRYLFMHNGGVAGFKQIKLPLLNLLSPELFPHIKGETDTEVLFHLWLTYFLTTKKTLENMVEAWRKVINTIELLQAERRISQATYINASVSDGKTLVVIRYSKNASPLSLHYAAGSAFIHTKEGCHMVPSKHKNHFDAIVVASERLTIHTDEWQDIPPQHFLTVDHYKAISLIPI